MSYIKLVFILSLTFQIVFGADLKSEGETDRDKALKHVALMLSLDDPSSASDDLLIRRVNRLQLCFCVTYAT